MAEKHLGRSRHQPPPISSIFRIPQRSRSVSNGLEREPKPVRVLDRKISVTTNSDVIQTKEKTKKVTQLIKHFEKSKSTENLHQSMKNLDILSPSTHRPPVSYNVGPPLLKRKSESIKTLAQSTSIPQQPSSFTQIKIDLKAHPISQDQPMHDTNSSTVPADSYRTSTETTSLESMTGLTQRSSSTSGEFIKSQSNDSLDKNRMILSERTNEIYTTEVTYVKTLYVLCTKIPAKMKETFEKDENLFETFNNVYKSLLNTIQKLYKFHYNIILPHIQLYKIGHRTDNIWSIFQEHFQTIEDLYKTYYLIYDEYQRELKRLDRSSSLKKIHQAMLACKGYLGNLCPLTEFNCPNQRLLRYILLMKSSMKNLDENSFEYEHTSFIHDEFNRIAIRCNEQLFISSAELNRLKSRVDNKLECFDTQQLLWHGLLKKQSSKKRHISQVYVILFSECILVCEESGSKLEIKRQLSIDNLIIENSIIFQSSTGQQSFYYSFRVTAIERSYEFLVDKESDREIWVNKMTQAYEDLKNRQSISNIRLSDRQQIGLRAPVWINIFDVTRCQICNHRFGLKLGPSGRHHCRSCGRCICSSCSAKKFVLKYRQKDGEVRICDTCYKLATGINRRAISSLTSTRHPEQTILFGDFRCSSSNSIVWIDLSDDYQIHVYNGRLDQIEDYSINLSDVRDLSLIEETRTFILNIKDKKYKFSMELNHKIFYRKNDYIDDSLKNRNNRLLFYAKLWLDTMQLARSKTLPLWYIRKRDSADSGISAVE